jgi:hypothetical protein
MNSEPQRRSIWRSLLSLGLWFFIVAVIALGSRCFYAFRDRSPGYSLTVSINGEAAKAHPRPLQVGFARLKIDPDLTRPDRPVWLAGFSQHRAATKIHDDLWAIACIIDDGSTRLGIVALDAIGFFHDDVVAVRERLGAHLHLDYTIICSTHNHSTPDLMGLWGPNYFQTGVDPSYREQVISACARLLADAVDAMEPARVSFYQIPLQPDGLVTDTRLPRVFDPDLRVMHFTHQVDGSTLGSIVAWADHPETPWGHNTEITADFPGYLRDALENGVMQDGKLLDPGVGGIHLYINGAIGGLMTTSPSVYVEDPYLKEEYREPSHIKARALGRQLAIRLLPLLRRVNSSAVDQLPIAIQAHTVQMPVSNKVFWLAPVLGLIDRGYPGLAHWTQLRSEVAVVTLGDATIACIPGEIYPELVNGGIERAPGGDFDIEPLEVPPIRDLLPGRVKFIFGLANDEIGYIIPKSEWDQSPPYIYGASHAPYGEINSVGPDAAMSIHSAIQNLVAP